MSLFSRLYSYTPWVWKTHTKILLGKFEITLLCFSVNSYQPLVSFTNSISVTSELSYPETAQKKGSVIQNRLHHIQIRKKHTDCPTPTLAFPVPLHLQILTGILKVVNTMNSPEKKWKKIQIWYSSSRETILISAFMENI